MGATDNFIQNQYYSRVLICKAYNSSLLCGEVTN